MHAKSWASTPKIAKLTDKYVPASKQQLDKVNKIRTCKTSLADFPPWFCANVWHLIPSGIHVCDWAQNPGSQLLKLQN